MAKCGSPEIRSPGTMSLWVYLTIVYKGMLGSFCMELQQLVLSHLCEKVSLRFHDTSSLSFICTSPAWCTWCSMLSNSTVFRTACPGAWELQIAHLRPPGLQSVPSALDTFHQTCSPSQAAASSTCHSIARCTEDSQHSRVNEHLMPSLPSALPSSTMFYASHQLLWFQCISPSHLYPIPLL